MGPGCSLFQALGVPRETRKNEQEERQRGWVCFRSTHLLLRVSRGTKRSWMRLPTWDPLLKANNLTFTEREIRIGSQDPKPLLDHREFNNFLFWSLYLQIPNQWLIQPALDRQLYLEIFARDPNTVLSRMITMKGPVGDLEWTPRRNPQILLCSSCKW